MEISFSQSPGEYIFGVRSLFLKFPLFWQMGHNLNEFKNGIFKKIVKNAEFAENGAINFQIRSF
jgi:hypothetical protein